MSVSSIHFFTLFRTDALLLKLSLVMGQQVFYGALWGSMLVSPLVRLPASVFIVTHFDRMVSIRQQAYMLGHDQRLVVSFCTGLLTHSSKLSSVLSPNFASSPTFFHLSEILTICLGSACLQVKSLCLSLQDSNVLVQRNMLEVLLYFFPFAELLVSANNNTLTSCIYENLI